MPTTADTGPRKRLGLIAGAGDLPARILASCREQGRDVFTIVLDGICSADDRAQMDLAPKDHSVAGIAQIGRIGRVLAAAKCAEVMLAGTVRKPDFATLAPDWEGIKLLPRVVAAATTGDDAILRVIISHLEGKGYSVVGIEDVAPGLLAPIGPLGDLDGAVHELDMRMAAEAAIALGERDAGQAAISRNGQVIALEDDAGTDAMLARVSATHPPSGVLAKMVKPMQDRRADLPTIGLATIANAARAGLAGIVVEAGGTLIIDREKVALAANAAGLFVVGLAPRSRP